MEVRKITVHKQVRVNTGDFQGTEHGLTMEAQLDDFDDSMECGIILGQRAETALLDQLVASYKMRNKSLTRQAIARTHGLAHHEFKDV